MSYEPTFGSYENVVAWFTELDMDVVSVNDETVMDTSIVFGRASVE
jgi:hypothetical protein